MISHVSMNPMNSLLDVLRLDVVCDVIETPLCAVHLVVAHCVEAEELDVGAHGRGGGQRLPKVLVSAGEVVELEYTE